MCRHCSVIRKWKDNCRRTSRIILLFQMSTRCYTTIQSRDEIKYAFLRCLIELAWCGMGDITTHFHLNKTFRSVINVSRVYKSVGFWVGVISWKGSVQSTVLHLQKIVQFAKFTDIFELKEIKILPQWSSLPFVFVFIFSSPAARPWVSSISTEPWTANAVSVWSRAFL